MQSPAFYVGGAALLKGQPVTIHQLLSSGGYLVLGKGITRRCTPDELKPVAASQTIEQWMRLRLDRASYGRVRVPIAQLYDAFWNWMHDLGTPVSSIPMREAFVEAMKAKGFKPINCYPRGEYRKRGQRALCWCFDIGMHEQGDGQ
jgi:hypothetical protein